MIAAFLLHHHHHVSNCKLNHRRLHVPIVAPFFVFENPLCNEHGFYPFACMCWFVTSGKATPSCDTVSTSQEQSMQLISENTKATKTGYSKLQPYQRYNEIHHDYISTSYYFNWTRKLSNQSINLALNHLGIVMSSGHRCLKTAANGQY